MGTTIVQRVQVGTRQFNAGQFNQVVSTTETIPDGETQGLLRMQNGFGHFGSRQWGRADQFTLRSLRSGSGSATAAIRLISSTGAILGEIRSDVEGSILREIQFAKLLADCKDFTLTTNAFPSFPLIPFAYIQIKLTDMSTGLYWGKVKDSPEPGDENESFVFKGFGLSEDLDAINGDERTFAALTDVGDAVLEIAEEIIAIETKIGIDTSKILNSTGVPFSGEFTLDRTSIKKTLDALSAMVGYDWGVDGDGDFFFLPKEANIVKTWMQGFNLHELKVTKNVASVKNRIVGTRTNPLGSGGSGYVIGAISIDEASQRKYGTREQKVSVPGEFSDADIQMLTDAILELKKEPQMSAKAKTYYLRDANDVIERGVSKIILPFKQYEVEYDSCDDPESTFTATGSGDLTVAQNETNHVDGNSSLLLEWTSASGDRAETINEIVGNIKRLRFYYRPSRAGTFLRVGVGLGVWNDYTVDIPVPGAAIDNFVLFDWDLSELNLKNLDRFAIQVIDALSGSVSVDRITYTVEGYRHLELANTKQVYKIGADEVSIDMELGEVPPRLEHYLSSLFAEVEEAKAAGQVR